MSTERAPKRATTKADLDNLLAMLRERRPHGSDGESNFMKTFIAPLDVEFDEYGNAYKLIGDSPIIWSSHIDTVHDVDGKQMITWDKDHVVTLHKNSKSNCLGADDTAGVWLMIELIKAERPGLYVFHRGEERGCLGSRWLIKHNADKIKGYKCVIALDRRGYGSVITRQMGGRCCSNEFAMSLAKHMNEGGADYKGDDGGTVTDSAHYTDNVGECTNLSVGYRFQHGSNEDLHVPHLCYVRNRLIALDGKVHLVYKREPGDKEGRYTYTSYNSTRRTYSDPEYEFDKVDNRDYTTWYVPNSFVLQGYWKNNELVKCTYGQWYAERRKFEAVQKALLREKEEADKKAKEEADQQRVHVDKSDYSRILALCYQYPQIVTKMMMDWGFDHDDLVMGMMPFADDRFRVYVQAEERNRRLLPITKSKALTVVPEKKEDKTWEQELVDTKGGILSGEVKPTIN